MPLPLFEFATAKTVAEAISHWTEGARYLAGGTDLLPQMRARRPVARVVDLKRIPELSRIEEPGDGSVIVGATVTLATIAGHPGIRRRFPLLVDCCSAVGAAPLRQRATMAGNICNASPAADTAVALLALEAVITVAGPEGTRTVPVTRFFHGPGESDLKAGELVTAVTLPGASAGMRGSYQRLARRRGMDLATVGVAVARSGNSSKPTHRVALAAVAPTPLRVPAAEKLLDADPVKAAVAAADAARDAARPITDVRGSADYRRDMVGVLVRRALGEIRA